MFRHTTDRRPTLRAHCEERGLAPALIALIDDLGAACAALGRTIARRSLIGLDGNAGGTNTHGEQQKALDVASHELFTNAPSLVRHLAGVASEEAEMPIVFDRPGAADVPYLLVIDPLDGSSNIDVNVSVGTIFSILEREVGAAPSMEDFLAPGNRQICAGYAIYGPATMLVLTTGKGVDGFTLDPDSGRFVLTHEAIRIPEETREFAINASNERFWEPPVRRYVRECLAGADGVRGTNFNMRWVASMVAEVHRILMRGGVFMYPRDTRDPKKPGRLRLMYEANPMSMVVEQADGSSSTGRERILDLTPLAVHERTPVLLGSRSEVVRIERYHREDLEENFTSPLFNTRSLFAAGNSSQ